MQIECLEACKTVTRGLSGHRIALGRRRRHLRLVRLTAGGRVDVAASDGADTPTPIVTEILFGCDSIRIDQSDAIDWYANFKINICVRQWRRKSIEGVRGGGFRFLLFFKLYRTLCPPPCALIVGLCDSVKFLRKIKENKNSKLLTLCN